jgi:hypothetical protein
MIQAIFQSIADVNNLLMPGMHTPTHYFMELCCCEDRSRLSNSCSSPLSIAVDPLLWIAGIKQCHGVDMLLCQQGLLLVLPLLQLFLLLLLLLLAQ